MKIGKKKISGTTALLLIAILALSATLASAITLLYTKSYTANWGVSTAYGLIVENASTLQPIASMSFLTTQGGSITENFILKNTGNHAVNVTDSIPASTATYTFSTTFLNSTGATPNTIAKGGTYAFSITFTDISEDSAFVGNGQFSYSVATGFSAPPSHDTFGATVASYGSDTAQYFSLQSSNFNNTNPALGAPVLWSWTTKNINQSYEIQAITYSLALENSSNSVIQQLETGRTQAYYETAPNQIGLSGNSTHMTTDPLMPNGLITLYEVFNAPSPASTYHMVLTYTGHNSQSVAITWTTTVINNWPSTVGVDSSSITGAAAIGQTGNLFVKFASYDGNPLSIDYAITVLDSNNNQIVTIATGTLNFNSPTNQNFNFNIPALAVGGNLKMQIQFSNLVGG